MPQINDKVKGIFSGKYLGKVVRIYKDQVIIETPAGDRFSMSAAMVETVPALREDGIERIFVA